MKKSLLSYILTNIIIIGAYNVVLFLVVTNYTQCFWVSYGFIMMAIVLNFLANVLFMNGNRGQCVVGVPTRVLSYMYVALAFILGTIFMFFPTISFNVVFIPQLILLVLFAVIYIPAVLNGLEKPSKDQKNNNDEERF